MILMSILSISIFLSYLNKPYWYVRIFDFPLLTSTILLVLCCIAFPFIVNDGDRWTIALLIASGIALVLSVIKLHRYSTFVVPDSLEPEYDDPQRQVSILSANVRQKNRQIDRFRQVIDTVGADIMIFYETDNWWAEHTAYLKDTYPYHVLVPKNNTYGMLLYSKLPLKDYAVNYLCLEDVPSIHAVVEFRNKQRFELYAVHPRPPRLYQSTDARDSEIVLIGRKIRQTKTPTILAGDLNDVPWSKALTLFRKMSNMIDPRRGRGFFNTYSCHVPFCRYPLDFFYFNSEFRVVDFHREKSIGSDHFPLYIKLSFEPHNLNPDNPYTLDGEARSDAEEIINQENRSIIPEFQIWSGKK